MCVSVCACVCVHVCRSECECVCVHVSEYGAYMRLSVWCVCKFECVCIECVSVRCSHVTRLQTVYSH